MTVEKSIHQDSQGEDVEEALLSKEELETEFLTFLLDVKDTPKRKLLKCIRNSTTRHAFFIHVLVLAIYSGIFFLLVQSQLRHESNRKPLIVSPATSALKIERRVLRNRVNATNPYKGLPSEELDQAWRELLRHSNIRLSAEELKEMGRTSVQLADGSGNYVGTLDVYHQLHCLKYIRHYMYRDYYPIYKTNVPSADHVDHCIDSLRQLVMCRADASIQTYTWIPDLRIPWANFETPHECTNWEALDGWAASRSFDLYDPKNLQHPTLGTSFPLGWEDTRTLEDESEAAHHFRK